jgi:hypothetical protein
MPSSCSISSRKTLLSSWKGLVSSRLGLGGSQCPCGYGILCQLSPFCLGMLLHTSRVKPINSSRSLQSSPSGPKRTMNLLLSSRICLGSLVVQEFWRYFRRSLITSTDEGYLRPSNRPWPTLNAASVLAFRSAWFVNTSTMSGDKRGGSSCMKTVAEQVCDVHSKAYLSPFLPVFRDLSSFLATSPLQGECTRWCSGCAWLGHGAMPSLAV